MSNLFSALRNSADALSVFERQLTVSQNNVANASTPGFARQRMSLEALPFDVASGQQGGVRAGPVETARDVFSEQAVQREVTAEGTWQQQVDTLSPIQGAFDISGNGGIPAAMNQLFQAFSAWSVAPNDSNARLGVTSAASGLAQAFQDTSHRLATAAADADTQLHGLVDQVNGLARQLQQFNKKQSAGETDPSLDAGRYAALEQLSELVPVTTLRQPDGTMTVLLAGQTPLVVGAFQYDIQAKEALPAEPPPQNPAAPPSSVLLDSAGNDITGQVASGKLGGLLDVRNGLLASLRGDSAQPGQLNQLAQAVADRVNGLLTAGNIGDGPPPVPGVPLFTYDPANPTAAAQTLAVNPAATPDQLAAIDPGPPYASNGVALKLAALASPTDAADKIGAASYTQFFGGMAAAVGRAVATAKDNLSTQQNLVSQARDLRQQTSGVSLDEEAITVMQFQRSYQAASKMVAVLDELTQTVVNLIQ